jgi:hypothetical protein
MRWCALFALALAAGCGFGGRQGDPIDAAVDVPIDAPVPPKKKPRRIRLAIPPTEVQGPLTDFPAYVELSDTISINDLKMHVDATASNLSFRVPGVEMPLAHEIAEWDPATGTLIAWVKLPVIEANTGEETVFELRYGTPEVAAAPNPPMVWSNGYLAVFHLDALVGGTTFVNSLGPDGNGTAVNVNAGRMKPGKLGMSVEFNNNNQVITFTNPLTGTGPSTFSAWVSQRMTNNNDSIIQVGDPMTNRSRFLYSRYNGNNIGNGLYANDWVTSTDIRNDGFRLVHWTYNARQGRLYVGGAPEGNPFTYAMPGADTAGTDGRIGNAKSPEFGNDMGIEGTVDEVRIANVARSAQWIEAEFRNQNQPIVFVGRQAPEEIP